MEFCEQCGAELDPADFHCETCGSEIVTAGYCMVCGIEVEDEFDWGEEGLCRSCAEELVGLP